VIEATSCKV